MNGKINNRRILSSKQNVCRNTKGLRLFKKAVSSSKTVAGTKRFFRNYGADIFSVLAGFGVIATGVSAYNAGKAERDENDGSDDRAFNREKALTRPILFGSGTIGCIYAARKCGKLKEESLLAACSVLALYARRKDELRTEEYAENTRGITDNDYSNNDSAYTGYGKASAGANAIEATGTGDLLFVEDLTGRRFTASLNHVQDCIKRLQDEFERHNFVPLNSFYGYLGISTTSAGDILGWSVNQSILDPYLDEEDYEDMKDALTDLGMMVRHYEGLGYVIHYTVMPIGGLPGVGPCDY